MVNVMTVIKESSTILPIVEIALSVVAVALSIYFGNTVFKKRILYRVARKGNSTIIAFWNASSRAIEKDDIYFLRVHCSEKANVERVYASDEDVKLHIVEWPRINDNKENSEYCYYLYFDFLPRREGYIIQIDSDDNSSIEFRGRLRGERKGAIKQFKHLDSWSIIFKILALCTVGMAMYACTMAELDTSFSGILVIFIACIASYCCLVPAFMLCIWFLLYDFSTRFIEPNKIAKEFKAKLQKEMYNEEKKGYSDFYS